MKNMKTTIGGVIIATGTACQASDNGTVKIVGIVLGVIGGLMLGASAKDYNVTGGTKAQTVEAQNRLDINVAPQQSDAK